MPSTTRGFPYPSTSDSPDVPRDMQALAQAVDTDVSTNLFGAWTLYTPTLTVTSGTNPTLGTGGYLRGRYRRIGKTVVVQAIAQFGTTGVNPGSGVYVLSLPPGLPVNSPGGTFDVAAIGTAFLNDSDVSGQFVRAWRHSGVMGYGAFVGNALPFTFAANDSIIVNATYETSA